MNEKINSIGLFTMINSLTSASLYGIFSSYLLGTAENASFISVIIGFLISLVIAKIILSFFYKYPELSYSDKMKKIHKKTSYFFIIISILISIFGYILFTYRLTTFLSTQYLVETPKYLISLLIIFITFYTASKGLEATIRVSTISFFISMFIFIFDFATLFNQIKLENILPIMTVSYKNIIITSIIFSFYFIIPITNIYSLKLNQIKDKTKFKKYYYLGIVLSFIIALISIISVNGISGIEINKLFDYPIYTVLKRIKLFSFLDSLENVSIMLWILFIINTSSMSLLFIFNTFKNTFNTNKKITKLFNYLVIIISFSIQNFIFSKNNYNESYHYIWIPFTILSIILIIIIYSLLKDRLQNK